MAKKTAAKKTVKELVEEVKDEGIDVEVVTEEPKEEVDLKKKDIIVHETGQLGYMDDDNNFVPV